MRFLNLILSAAVAAALPTPESSEGNQSQPFSQNGLAPWDAGAVNEFPIHSSCNATQRRQIAQGLNETIAIAEHAKNHILRWGNESTIYKKFFGGRPTMETIGAFDVVVNGDRKDLLFRCDNPDGNCDIEGYAGHWRGENGTHETVICDLSYQTRRSLSTMCGLGYTVSQSETNTFWATDLLHRLYHVPAIGQNWVDHFADGYEAVVDMAKTNATLSTHDSESLQYFALEVYAYDIAVPGVGCAGVQHTHDEADEADAQTTSAAVTSQSTPTATTTDAPSTTSSVPANCHTHDGGVLHCT